MGVLFFEYTCMNHFYVYKGTGFFIQPSDPNFGYQDGSHTYYQKDDSSITFFQQGKLREMIRFFENTAMDMMKSTSMKNDLVIVRKNTTCSQHGKNTNKQIQAQI